MTIGGSDLPEDVLDVDLHFQRLQLPGRACSARTNSATVGCNDWRPDCADSVDVSVRVLRIEGFLRAGRDLGYDPHNVMSVIIPFHEGTYKTWPERATYFQQLRAKPRGYGRENPQDLQQCHPAQMDLIPSSVSKRYVQDQWFHHQPWSQARNIPYPSRPHNSRAECKIMINPTVVQASWWSARLLPAVSFPVATQSAMSSKLRN